MNKFRQFLSELFDAPNFVVGLESMLNEFNKCLKKNCLPKQKCFRQVVVGILVER